MDGRLRRCRLGHFYRLESWVERDSDATALVDPPWLLSCFQEQDNLRPRAIRIASLQYNNRSHHVRFSQFEMSSGMTLNYVNGFEFAANALT